MIFDLGPITTNDAILAVTAAVVIWYTFETYKLRKEAQVTNDLARESRDLSLLPLLTLTYDNPGITVPGGFRLVNIGHGTALNVEIARATVARNGNETVTCDISPADQVLPAGHKSTVSIASFLNGQSDGENSACLYLSSDTDERISLKLKFRNALGHRYRTVLKKTSSGYEISTPPKRIR